MARSHSLLRRVLTYRLWTRGTEDQRAGRLLKTRKKKLLLFAIWTVLIGVYGAGFCIFAVYMISFLVETSRYMAPLVSSPTDAEEWRAQMEALLLWAAVHGSGIGVFAGVALMGTICYAAHLFGRNRRLLEKYYRLAEAHGLLDFQQSPPGDA